MLLAALAWDLTLGEPPAFAHPVVWVGRLIDVLERAPVKGAPAQLVYGGVAVTVGLLLVVGPATVLLAYLRAEAPALYLLAGTYLLKSTFSLRGLFRAAWAVRRCLLASDLPGARWELRALVSRDTSGLDEPLLAAAAVESVAENSSDALVAPLLYFTLFGVPGALAYRVLNTFDSMIGYRGRYEYLGKVAARLDDLANLLPARLTALLLVLASAWRGAGAAPAWQGALHYAGATESPNAGWPMSAMAGALGVTLEKVGHYRLGDGPARPDAASIERALALAAVALLTACLISLILVVLRDVYVA
jgi:adenosylcobinamide-phosphate synthase